MTVCSQQLRQGKRVFPILFWHDLRNAVDCCGLPEVFTASLTTLLAAYRSIKRPFFGPKRATGRRTSLCLTTPPLPSTGSRTSIRRPCILLCRNGPGSEEYVPKGSRSTGKN